MPHRTLYSPRCDGSSDPDLWFRPSEQAMTAAARICGRCELKDACLETAMQFPDDEQWGVWGGLTAAARRALRAADPDRYPVTARTLLEYVRDEDVQPEEFSDFPTVANGRRRPQVSTTVPSWESSASALMDRYENVTEVCFGLPQVAGIVQDITEMAA